MHLKKRECSDPAFFDEVFGKAQELFLAMHDSDFPYLIPVNFCREGTRIYIHCALEGTKLDLIRRDKRVSFSLIADVSIDLPKATTYYKSVCGTGYAHIVEDPAEKGHALDCIGSRYNARCQRPAPQRDIERVGIIRIDIVSLQGKRALPKPQENPSQEG